MSMMPTTRFDGQLAGYGETISVIFDAHVDNRGVLQLRFDPLPISSPALFLARDVAGSRRVTYWNLTGNGAIGESFRSEKFYVSSFGHRSGPDGLGTVEIEGSCSMAEVLRPMEQDVPKAQLVWRVRQFNTHRHLHRDMPTGRLLIAGHEPAEDQQAITGHLAIVETDTPANPAWWADAERQLEHVTRVLSLACGTYLRPYVEQRIQGRTNTLRIYGRSDAAKPFLPPFHFLHLEPIFNHACDSFQDRYSAFRALDAALQWLLTPAHYDEMRLFTSMTALENLLEIDTRTQRTILKPTAFKKIATALRVHLVELGVPQTMLAKLPELNRPSFADQLAAFFVARNLVIDDFPEDAIAAAISARNAIVHRGIYFDEARGPQTDLWDHIITARELVIRALLSALGFQGAYFSQLHGNKQIMFPTCCPLAG